MSGRPFLFELSGEHPTLPRSEVLSCLNAECTSFTEVAHGPGYVICNMQEDELDRVVARLALTHRAGRYLGCCTLNSLDEFASCLQPPPGSVAVRVKQYQRMYPEIDSSRIAGKVGTIIKKNAKIDLESPEVEIRILMSDALHFFVSDKSVDRRQFDGRKVAFRPFFSPISLHPRFARALVNLSRIRRGQQLLDPFCGTGGVLIEAALIGAKVLGSDISEDMVLGCMENMSHFGVTWEEIRVADVGEISDMFGTVDAIVTDPPYGRSATTKKEPPGDLYERALAAMASALRQNGSLAVVFPTPCLKERQDLETREMHTQRVHRSLTRNYCIFTKRSGP